MSVWFLYPVEESNICLSMCLYFLRYQMSVVQVFIIYFWIYVLKLKNTFRNTAIGVSAECYLTDCRVCFAKLLWVLNFLEFLFMGCHCIKYTDGKQWGQFITALKKSRHLYFWWEFWSESKSPKGWQPKSALFSGEEARAGHWDSGTISGSPYQVKSTWPTLVGKALSWLWPNRELMAATAPMVIGQWHRNWALQQIFWDVTLWVAALLCLEPQWNRWVKWATEFSFLHRPQSLLNCSLFFFFLWGNWNSFTCPFPDFSAFPFYSWIWGHQKVSFSALMLLNWTFLQLWLLVSRNVFPWILAKEHLRGRESPWRPGSVFERHSSPGMALLHPLTVREGYS